MKERSRQFEQQQEQESRTTFLNSASGVTRDLLGANWSSSQGGRQQYEEHSNKYPSSSSSMQLDNTCSNLELNLFPYKSYNTNSVCTLDKVKSALERAKRSESAKKRHVATSFFPPSACQVVEEDEEDKGAFAACCPGCLLYVLAWRSNPKCPHCATVIVPLSSPVSLTMKRPEIDLNSFHN